MSSYKTGIGLGLTGLVALHGGSAFNGVHADCGD